MEMDSTSAVMLTGRTEGPFVDLVIYQDRKWSADFFNLNADSQSKFSGVVYLPNSPLRLNSRSGFTAGSITMYSMLVARRVELNSKANLLIDNSAFKSKLGQLQNKGPALTQ